MTLLYNNHVYFLTHCFWLLFCIGVLLFLCNSQFLERRFVLGVSVILSTPNTFLSCFPLYNNPLLKDKTYIFLHQNSRCILDSFQYFFALFRFSYGHMPCRTNKSIGIFIVIKFIFFFSSPLCYCNI